MTSYVVAALYKFAAIEDPIQLQQHLQAACLAGDLRGTLLVAHEGINGTVAGTNEALERLLTTLRNDPRFIDLPVKFSYVHSLPFLRMKVRLKKEIVTLGVPDVDPNRIVGEYVAPNDWNALIQDPEVLVIDTRNQYEIDIGTFGGAISPQTENFRDFPQFVKRALDPQKNKKIAMFCTGGIRCEKATSYLRSRGFEQVFHLKGGILKYLEEIPAQDSLWRGECFVFDGRVAVNHQLKHGRYLQCFGCRHPLDKADQHSPFYKAGVYCPHCYNTQTAKHRSRAEQRQRQIALARQRNQVHLGPQAQSNPGPQAQSK